MNAYVSCRKNNGLFIEPTWVKFSIGPWIRHEKDKRIYHHLFSRYGIHGIQKLLLLTLQKNKLIVFDKLGTYFQEFNRDFDLVNEYIQKITRKDTIDRVPEEELEECIAIHVRLGDYLPQLRVNLNWYVGIVQNILEINPEIKFKLFTDGTEEEVSALLSFYAVEKVFYGNAFADMYAISKCKMVIASDSTFSAWGAFLGQKPILFNKRHFPPIYQEGTIPEYVVGDSVKIPDEFISFIF